MRRAAAGALLFLACMAARPASALEARVVELRAAGGTVRAAVDVRELFPEKFQSVLEGGGAIHLRLQLELWQDRPVWDKLAHPALVSIFRILLDPATRQVSVADQFGEVSRQPAWQEPLSLRMDLAREDELDASAKYYVRLLATLGTVADRDPAGEAALGGDDGSIGLRSMGRAIFHAVLDVADYLQSVSSEWRSRAVTGQQITAGLSF